jgi:sugar lactone lactonase YvrE
LSGPADALLWDDSTSTLYLSDNNADSLLKYTDANQVQTVGTFPSETAGIVLGGIVKRADGTIVTPSFGFGTQGTLFSMAANGTSSALTGLDPTRRRTDLSQDGNGVLYDAYFVTGASPSSGVSTVTISGGAATETELASGFEKLVGIVATSTALFVSDQTQATVFKIAIAGGAVTTVGAAPTVGFLTILPNGDLLTSGGTVVYRLTQAGVLTTAFTGFSKAAGLAFDPTLKRLFIVDQGSAAGDNLLRIEPLDG